MEGWAGDHKLRDRIRKNSVNVEHLFDIAAHGAFLIENNQLFQRLDDVDHRGRI
jgi:hypothetical protein